MISPQALLMLPKSAVQITCASSVETSIHTFKDVGVRHRKSVITGWLSAAEANGLSPCPHETHAFVTMGWLSAAEANPNE